MLKQPRADLFILFFYLTLQKGSKWEGWVWIKWTLREILSLHIEYKRQNNSEVREDLAQNQSSNKHGNSLTKEWITGFPRYPLLDLGEITQASLRGRAQGVWVHLQALLWASPQAGLWVSATQKHNSQYKVFICWFTGILWSLCTRKKLYYTVCIPRLLMTTRSLFNGSFKCLKSCVKHMHLRSASWALTWVRNSLTHWWVRV